MTPEQLKAIEERANAATPGPWQITGPYGSDVSVKGGGVVAEVIGDEDIDFIANARQDIPALINRVRELEDEIEEFRQHRDRLLAMLDDEDERSRQFRKEHDALQGYQSLLGISHRRIEELETENNDLKTLWKGQLKVIDRYYDILRDLLIDSTVDGVCPGCSYFVEAHEKYLHDSGYNFDAVENCAYRRAREVTKEITNES